MRSYPYAFHIALDGNGLNGLEGRAGVCLFQYDPVTGDHAYKVTYYPGASGGHAPNVDPSRRIGFLGNTGQHLLFYDLATLEEADRVSTLRFEVPDTTIDVDVRTSWLPMEKLERSGRLVDHAKAIAKRLGFEVNDTATGGASDANTTSGMGVPSLDGLGPIGGNDHSPSEYMDVDSVVPRTTLLAGLLLAIARDPDVVAWREDDPRFRA